MKYYAFSTTLSKGESLTGCNKFGLVRQISAHARANRPTDNTACFMVGHYLEDGRLKYDFAGGVLKNGKTTYVMKNGKMIV